MIFYWLCAGLVWIGSASPHFVGDEPPHSAAALELAIRDLWTIDEPARETLELDRRILRLAKLRDPGFVRPLLEAHDRAPRPVRLRILECLGGIPLEQARVFLENRLERPDWQVRASALASLIEDPHRRRSRVRILVSLEDSAWQVRAAALRGLSRGGFYPPQIIPALIDSLEREQGRLEAEALLILQSLTGHGDFGPEPQVWRDWFAGLADRATPRSGRYRRPTYYGVRIDSKRPVFIIDTSGSMAETASLTLPTGRTWGPALAPFLNFDGPVTRIGRARLELAQALVDLESDDFFGIVFFSSSATAWRNELVPARPQPRGEALERVLTLGGRGSTNLHDALRVALEVSFGENQRPGTEGPDTIFLLTDGVPTSGDPRSEEAIRSWFRRENRVRQMQVHTFGIGEHARRLLEGLAADSGGTYSDLSR